MRAVRHLFIIIFFLYLLLPVIVWCSFPASAWRPRVELYYSSGADLAEIRNPLAEFIWGAGGLVHAWPANPVRTSTRVSRTRTSRRCSSVGRSTSRRRPRTPRRSCCRTFPTRIRSSCPRSARGRLLFLRAESQHAVADQVLRHRPGRHVRYTPNVVSFAMSPLQKKDGLQRTSLRQWSASLVWLPCGCSG